MPTATSAKLAAQTQRHAFRGIFDHEQGRQVSVEADGHQGVGTGEAVARLRGDRDDEVGPGAGTPASARRTARQPRARSRPTPRRRKRRRRQKRSTPIAPTAVVPTGSPSRLRPTARASRSGRAMVVQSLQNPDIQGMELALGHLVGQPGEPHKGQGRDRQLDREEPGQRDHPPHPSFGLHPDIPRRPVPLGRDAAGEIHAAGA